LLRFPAGPTPSRRYAIRIRETLDGCCFPYGAFADSAWIFRSPRRSS
jgi:hypothetical protein